MEDSSDSVNERIAAALRALRAERGLSLDALAGACGVSRSALSLIERAASSPTAVVLDKIAAGLGVALSTLFVGPPHEAASPLARRDEQPVWRDPESGYQRRSVSPSGGGTPIHIVEVTFPAGARVAYETSERRTSHQQVWRPAMFHNPTAKDAHYVVVFVSEPTAGRNA